MTNRADLFGSPPSNPPQAPMDQENITRRKTDLFEDAAEWEQDPAVKSKTTEAALSAIRANHTTPMQTEN